MTEHFFDLYRRQQRNPVEAEGDGWLVTISPDLGRVLTERTDLGFKGRQLGEDEMPKI